MKKTLLSATMLIFGIVSAQVGIKTPNPKAILDIKGTNYNPTGTSNDEGKATLRVDGNTNHSLDVGTFASDPFGAYLQSKDKSQGTGLPLILNPVGGNIGIKTTNPTQLLDVNGKARVRTLDNASKTDNVMFSTSEGVLEKSDITYEQLNKVISLPTSNSNAWNLTGNNNAVQGTSFFGTTNAVDLDVKTNNIQRIRVKADNGKVGIGTVNPEGNLHVVGNNYDPKASDEGTQGNYATFRIDGGTNHSLDMGTVASGSYGSYLQSHNKGAAGGLPFAINPNGGRVGINTLSPQETLDVNGGIQLRNNIRLGGSDSSQGDAGKPGQVLVSQGENKPAKWVDVSELMVNKSPIYAFGEGRSAQNNIGSKVIYESPAGVMQNGLFTAPETGIYIVSAGAPLWQGAAGSIFSSASWKTILYLNVNGGGIASYRNNLVTSSQYINSTITNFSRIVKLNKGDVLKVVVDYGATGGNSTSGQNLTDYGTTYISVVKVD
nr:hypothetical protein [uncultured Chryseobacterium sp.]